MESHHLADLDAKLQAAGWEAAERKELVELAREHYGTLWVPPGARFPGLATKTNTGWKHVTKADAQAALYDPSTRFRVHRARAAGIGAMESVGRYGGLLAAARAKVADVADHGAQVVVE